MEARARALLMRQGVPSQEIDDWLNRAAEYGFLTAKDFAALHGVDTAVVFVWLDKDWIPEAYKISGVWHLPLDSIITFRRRRKGPRRSFSPDAIKSIRGKKAAGATLKEIASAYDICESMVSRIVNRSRYGDVA